MPQIRFVLRLFDDDNRQFVDWTFEKQLESVPPVQTMIDLGTWPDGAGNPQLGLLAVTNCILGFVSGVWSVSLMLWGNQGHPVAPMTTWLPLAHRAAFEKHLTSLGATAAKPIKLPA